MLPLPRLIHVRFEIQNILFGPSFPGKIDDPCNVGYWWSFKWNAYTFNLWTVCISECDGHVELSATT